MSGSKKKDDGLAYGDDYSQSRGSGGQSGSSTGSGFLGGLKKLKSAYDQHQQSSQQQQSYGYTSSTSNQSYSGGYGGPAGSNFSAPAPGQSAYQGGPPVQHNQPQKHDASVTGVLSGLAGAASTLGTAAMSYANKPSTQTGQTGQSAQHGSVSGAQLPIATTNVRSFASQKAGNDVKWYVDGCGYFWAVSKALESAKQSIWILDWWLSPEVYLRRPPSQNEEWRLDRVLLRAAQRGVKVNIIVYKEVTQALSKTFSPSIISTLHSFLPSETDVRLSALLRFGLEAAATSLHVLEQQNPLINPPLALSSYHTKHALEALSPNIAVFRHPDHLPDPQTTQSSITSAFQGLRLDAAGLAKMGADTLKGIYGLTDDVILYWAHHEKLCVIDNKVAFMGGLDLCFGRWDTNQHPIADAHPTNLNKIVFPGQDYNDARIMDFENVSQPFENKLDRTKEPRMGWSDVAISLQGSCVADLCHHFIDRWNFIYDEKYNVRKDIRYSRIPDPYSHASGGHTPGQKPVAVPEPQYGQQPTTNYPPPPGSYQQGQQQSYAPGYGQGPPTEQSHSQIYGQSPQSPENYNQSNIQGQSLPGQYFPPPPQGQPPQNNHPSQSLDGSYQPYSPQSFPPPPGSGARGVSDDYQQGSERGPGSQSGGYTSKLDQYRQQGKKIGQELSSIGNLMASDVQKKYSQYQGRVSPGAQTRSNANMTCQVLRSCTKWSMGVPTEHSIQDAYIEVIQNSKHFIYIENQFFITATGSYQDPVKNQIGKALADRIIRAAKNNERFKIVVVIPSVPAFAGDLRDDSSLGTRAIMEFQYNSINRGGNSIMQLVAKEGINPLDYIRFYNLRNYDRINVGRVMQQAEKQSGVSYEDARKQHDDVLGAGYANQGEATGVSNMAQANQFQNYQAAAQNIAGPDTGRWDTVSECYMLGGEDIRKVPWYGAPDQEINAFVSEELYIHTKCMIVDDQIVLVGSANLNDRSQLGDHDSEIVLKIQDPTVVQAKMAGQPWQASRFAASLRRQLVRKHLGLLRPQDMQRPDANFEPIGVPNDYDWGSSEDNVTADPLSDIFVNLWNSRARTNTEVFRKAFRAVPDDNVHSWNDYKEFYEYYFRSADAEASGKKEKRPARYEWGHVVREEFPGGVTELKELLSTVKGTLVEMPLTFLQEEDIAKTGLALNPITEPIYT